MAQRIEKDKQRVDKGKRRMEKNHKKRKLSHSNSTSGTFSTTVVPATKQVVFSPSKLMEASMKAVQVEMIWRANEKAAKEKE